MPPLVAHAPDSLDTYTHVYVPVGYICNTCVHTQEWINVWQGGIHVSSLHWSTTYMSVLSPCSPPSLLLLCWVVTSNSLAVTGSQLL